MISNVTLRVIPFLVLLFYFDMMTRMNIANVHDKMIPALHLSEGSYSTAVGAFFATYVLFQMPSNMMLRHVRPSLQFGIVIMFIGIVGASTAFVRNEKEFIINRLILGVLQSGCYPGIIYVITVWFSEKDRPTKISSIDIATLCSSVSSGFLAAGILHIDKIGGLAGWQWVFVAESAPAVIVGVLIICFLPDSPQHAKWLTEEQKKAYADAEVAAHKTDDYNKVSFKATFFNLFGNWKLLLLSTAYFCSATAAYGYGFYAPSVIASLGVSPSMSNLITTPLSVGTFVVGISYAKICENFKGGRWPKYAILAHIFTMLLMVSFGLVVMYEQRILSWIFLVLFQVFVNMGFSPFLVWLTTILTGPPTSKALGIAFANSMANLGGIAGPKLIAHFETGEGYGKGIVAMGACVGACVLLQIIVYAISSYQTPKSSKESEITAVISEADPLLN